MGYPLKLTAGLIGPLIVACTLFMENADANILVTALPSMARDFGADADTLKIAITSYVVSLGVFIPVCGWLADRFGSRSVFLTAIGIFVAGSLMCAASPSLHEFMRRVTACPVCVVRAACRAPGPRPEVSADSDVSRERVGRVDVPDRLRRDPFLLPLALQDGMNAFASGLITCASAFGSMFMRAFSSFTLHNRFSHRAHL
ncbi:MFS family permease [Paraburkholderia atlantica]